MKKKIRIFKFLKNRPITNVIIRERANGGNTNVEQFIFFFETDKRFEKRSKYFKNLKFVCLCIFMSHLGTI